jgi:Na+-driven multidrug efflux pump
MGFLGAWLAATVYICLLGVACVYRFRQGVWKEMGI